jgi:hypothetical protein
MKVLLSSPDVLRVRGMGSSAFRLVVVELMLSMLRVLTTLFEKAARREVMRRMESAPPRVVWYSGSSLNLKNSVVLKKSHLDTTFFMPFNVPIALCIIINGKDNKFPH